MFFLITNNETPYSFPFKQVIKFQNFWVTLDSGWHQIDDFLYKGYCLEQSVAQKIAIRDFSEQTGNYVILDLSDNNCKIYYDNSRSFPICYNENTVTNFKDEDLTDVWFDGTVEHKDNRWNYVHRPENTIKHSDSHAKYTKQEIVDFYCEYLIQCCNQLKTELPLYCADSGGVDSLAVRSAFDYCNVDYTLVKNNSREKSNLGWGYKQIFVSDTPHIQITGFCGDELLQRNPLYCQWLLDSEDINLIQEFDKVEYSYMKGFFNENYRKKIKPYIGKFRELASAFEHTANVALNDYQMWHTDETITFTPFRNKDMAVKCLYADADAILDQVIHAGISKEIINRLNSKNLNFVSKHKNDVC